MERLCELKLLLDIQGEEQDELLLSLLDHSEKYALAYCHLESPDSFIDSLTVRMAAEDYGKLGAEGIESRSFSGLSENFDPTYSDRIISALRSVRKPKVIG